MGFAGGRLAPVISAASRWDRCSAFTQQLPELACASADLRASTFLVAAGWNQAPARPARKWSMQAVIGRSCASQRHPTGPGGWYGATAGGSPKVLGEGSGLSAPAGCPGCRPRRTARAGVRRRALERYADKLHGV
jgi:hypothetical protein